MLREFKRYAIEMETAYNKAKRNNIQPDNLISEKISLIRDMIKYIYNGDWARKASRDKLRALIKNDFDYEFVCKAYNTTRASLDVFVHRQDQKLESYIGEAFELIRQDRVQEARISFYARTHYISADNQFQYILFSLLPAASLEQQFQLADCQDEIKLLSSLMKTNIEDMINQASREKLSYLLGLLSSDNKHLLMQRKNLIEKMLSGNNFRHILS